MDIFQKKLSAKDNLSVMLCATSLSQAAVGLRSLSGNHKDLSFLDGKAKEIIKICIDIADEMKAVTERQIALNKFNIENN